MKILPPLLSGLQAAHQAGFMHQNISPDNIYLRNKDHSPVLIDFGAARYSLCSRRNVKTIIAPGYAPFEQYQIKQDNQGPWTDIYALGAVLYRLICGISPIEAPARVDLKEPLPPTQQIGSKRYPKRFLQGIDWALEIAEKDRPQNVEEWTKILLPKKPLFKWQINWQGLVGVIMLIGLIVSYMFYTEQRLEQLRLQQEPQLQKLQQQAAAEAARLTKVRQAREAEEECLTQLQQQTAAEELRLFQLRQAGETEERQPATNASLVKPTPPPSIFRDRLQIGGFGPQMVEIPAGRFQMGDIHGDGYKEERPVRWVAVKNFAIGRYEVTFAEYDRFAKATGKEIPKDDGWGRCNRPVLNVSWHDAMSYVKWLSKQTGRHYRLPTEAEWEYAARAGTKTKYWWGNEIGSNRANCDGCGSWDDKTTAPVGYFAPNQFGLYDVVGNVWEWSVDPWHSNYNGAPSDKIVWKEEEIKNYYSLRGGTWFTGPKNSRSASRTLSNSDNRNYLVGFRVVCDLDST